MSNNFRGLLVTLATAICLLIAPGVALGKVAAKKAVTPSAQALRVYQSLRDQDYTAMFYILAFTEKGRASLTTAERFAIDAKRGYDQSFKTPEEKKVSDDILLSISEIKVGEPVITGGKAVVPTSAKITVDNKIFVFKGEAHLIKDFDGVWKLDLTFDENPEAAMAQRTTELLGKPATTP
jgi:hypothetical protein